MLFQSWNIRKATVWFVLLVPVLLSTPGCTAQKKPSSQKAPSGHSQSLTEARQGFQTTLRPQQTEKEPVAQAPRSLFQTVKYPAPAGELAAYLSPDPHDGKKHPVIIWITGGDCNSIGDVWTPASRDNDQTAAAYRQAGILMMFPSLRGGNDNPGIKEGFLGEVNDVLAAADFLARQSDVDPKRIYLGGHSTGGTLALLVAESSARFRAVFAFGPIGDVSQYGADSGFLPFESSRPNEVELRSPGNWLPSVHSPVWVFEGTGGNIDALRTMAAASNNPQIHFLEIENADHFATLAPTNALLARKIIQDTTATSSISISKEEVNQNFQKFQP